MNKEQSYIGSGRIYLRELGSTAGFQDLGNCSALTLSPQTDTKKLADFTQPGGGTANQIERLTGVTISYSFHDFSAENLARALRGNITATAAGTVTDEEVVAKKGTFIPLLHMPTAITSVESASGTTVYEEGLDYEARAGGIFIPATSGISDGAVVVSYAHAAQKTVQALVNPAKQYELLFEGLNEAQSGAPVRVRAYKVSGGVLQQMAMIADDYATGEVSGELLKDTTRIGAGVSQYYTVTVSD